MSKKTILITAGVTIAAAFLWRAWRKGQLGASAKIAAQPQNVRDTVTQRTAGRTNLGIDLDPAGL